MAEILDISQPLDSGIPVWQGDEPFSYQLRWSFESTGSVNVGTIVMSAHTGTHIDAPFHFDNNGKRVIDLDPSVFVGKARVIAIEHPESIGVDELKVHDLSGISRLLIKTSAWTQRDLFPAAIPHIQPEAAAYLNKQGIRLLGLDLPSVDPLDSKSLDAHHRLTEHDICILEGAVLDHVMPGDYELIALPLALKDADGSPVRAVLRTYE
ncbi:MAG TPA: arylformamidase [Bacillales bacterium]|nr:arylformamidase [Bacillales bacterium]